MSFSRQSMLLNSRVLLEAIAAKETNTILLPDIEQMHSMCSIKPLATQKMYTNCDAMEHPNNRKPKSTLSLNGNFRVDCCDRLMPKIAYCRWTFPKIFMSGFENGFLEYPKSSKIQSSLEFDGEIVDTLSFASFSVYVRVSTVSCVDQKIIWFNNKTIKKFFFF